MSLVLRGSAYRGTILQIGRPPRSISRQQEAEPALVHGNRRVEDETALSSDLAIEQSIPAPNRMLSKDKRGARGEWGGGAFAYGGAEDSPH